jgi:chromate transporter
LRKNFETYKKLFTSSFYISLFIIGGGYVAIPLLQKRFVDDLKWIQKDEMSDLAAIAQSGPGAIAVNASVSVGYKIAGTPGAICTLIGTLLPPLILISIIQKFYSLFISNQYISALFRGMNCAVAAIMIVVVINMGRDAIRGLKYLSAPLMLLAFILVYFLKVNPALVVLGCIVTGIILSIISGKKRRSEKQ